MFTISLSNKTTNYQEGGKYTIYIQNKAKVKTLKMLEFGSFNYHRNFSDQKGNSGLSKNYAKFIHKPVFIKKNTILVFKKVGFVIILYFSGFFSKFNIF